MNWSVMKLFHNERVCWDYGLYWTCLLWMWSVMKRSVMNVVSYEEVSYERGRLWKWSVVHMVYFKHGLLRTCSI